MAQRAYIEGSQSDQHRHFSIPVVFGERHAYACTAGPGVASPPVNIRRAALVSCRRLLPCMHLAGFSSNILHPLLRVLDGGIDELRTDALDTICSLALALGPDFPIFAPTVRKVCAIPFLSSAIWA